MNNNYDYEVLKALNEIIGEEVGDFILVLEDGTELEYTETPKQRRARKKKNLEEAIERMGK